MVVVGVEQQKLVVDALRELHKLLDDDKSGGIDSSESKDVCMLCGCICACSV